jgi:hypothetical protein
MMRSALVLTVLLAATLSGREAHARDYAWCAWYDWTTYNCGFDTFQQCLASVSGVGGECRPNVRYRPSQERRGRRDDRRRDRR